VFPCFVSDIISGVVLGLSSGPRPELVDGSVLLNFSLETRLKSKFFDTLDDLLGFWAQKL